MSIYKSTLAKTKIMNLYNAKLEACKLPNSESIYIDTKAGRTHVIVTGPKERPPVVILHGINAGAPVSLEALKDLYGSYRMYAIDSIGQTTRSDENRLSVKDASYGIWLGEVMDGLELEKADVLGISYGGFLLQKLIIAHPEKVKKAIFLVPGGLVNSNFVVSMKRLFFPLTRFLLTKKETHLKKFIRAFYTEIDDYALDFQRETLLGVRMDYSRPPLLKPKDVSNFKNPVYAILVDDDVFFPNEASLLKLKQAFSGFKDYYLLKDSKHIPASYQYPEIAACLDKWLQE